MFHGQITLVWSNDVKSPCARAKHAQHSQSMKYHRAVLIYIYIHTYIYIYIEIYIICSCCHQLNHFITSSTSQFSSFQLSPSRPHGHAEAQRLQQQWFGASTGTCAAVATWRWKKRTGTKPLTFFEDLGKARKPMTWYVYILILYIYILFMLYIYIYLFIYNIYIYCIIYIYIYIVLSIYWYIYIYVYIYILYIYTRI